jgi:hypothetical protein
MSRPLIFRLPGWVRAALLAALLPVTLPAQPPGRCRFDALSSTPSGVHPQHGIPAGRTSGDAVLRVPVVVHLVSRPSAPVVTDAQVHAQLRVLNEDFRRRNADTVRTLPVFRPVAADCGIEFYLAPADPDGNATSGITRTVTAHGPFANDDIHRSSAGGRDGWDPARYLNVWVCNLAAGISGYGTPPGGPGYQDGVVVHYQHFGTGGTALAPYDRGRSATHEVGHWLGLKHPWGVPGGCTDDDGIADTPPQEGASAGCDPGRVSCGGFNMVQNFMDYSADACLNLFTAGQRDVMRSTLLGPRRGVTESGGYVLAAEARTTLPKAYPVRQPDGWGLPHPFPGGAATVRVYNALGYCVAQSAYAAPGPAVLPLPLAGRPTGVYLIRVQSGPRTRTLQWLYNDH